MSEVYAIAGHIFGLLQQKIGSGKLVMTGLEYADGGVRHGVDYQWYVSIRGKSHGCSRAVRAHELHEIQEMQDGPERFATQLAEQWRHSLEHAQQQRPCSKNACCDNEDRTINGGCRNCGAPGL